MAKISGLYTSVHNTSGKAKASNFKRSNSKAPAFTEKKVSRIPSLRDIGRR